MIDPEQGEGQRLGASDLTMPGCAPAGTYHASQALSSRIEMFCFLVRRSLLQVLLTRETKSRLIEENPCVRSLASFFGFVFPKR